MSILIPFGILAVIVAVIFITGSHKIKPNVKVTDVKDSQVNITIKD